MEKELNTSGTSIAEKENAPTEPNLLADELGVGRLLIEAEEIEKEERRKQLTQQKEEEQQQPAQQQQQQLILGRFKSYEDLEKAYKELEKVYTQTSQELSRLKKTTQQKENNTQKEEYDPDKFYEEFINNPRKAIEPITRQIVQEVVEPLKQIIQPLQVEREMQYIRNVIDNFKAQHPDFEQYEAQITEIINNEIPANSNLNAQQLLEISYAMAKARNMGKVVEQAKTTAQQELLSKQKAFVETSANASQRFATQRAKTPEEEIKESIVAAEATNPLLE